MKLNYSDLEFIINSYKRFNGDLKSVKSSFQIKSGKDVSYKDILKVISNFNNINMDIIKNNIKNNDNIFKIKIAV